MIYAFAFLAAVAAVGAEALYSVTPSFWCWQIFLSMVVVQPIIAYGVYNLVKASPNLIVAIVVFSFSTLALRVFWTVAVQRGSISLGTWLSLLLLVAAQFARRF